MRPAGTSPLRIGLIGERGRMGQAVAAAIAESPDLILDRDQADVLIDFSDPGALAASIDRAVAAAIPLVVGTTGLDELADERIARAARHIAVLRSANMSLGVTLLAHLVAQAAARLGPEWDVEILEMHHRAKVDAPSGTALLLGANVELGRAAIGRGAASGKPVLREPVLAGDRSGARIPGAIGYASLRGGTVAGDHDVIFAGPSERLILGHRAESRAVFARGALAAARWIADRPPGVYAMADILDLG